MPKSQKSDNVEIKKSLISLSGTLLTAIISGFFLLLSSGKIDLSAKTEDKSETLLAPTGLMITQTLTSLPLDEVISVDTVAPPTEQPIENYETAPVPDLYSRLVELSNTGRQVKQVALWGESGWLILYDKNSLEWNELPSGLEDKLKELQAEDQEIRQVAFTSGGDRDQGPGWAILYGRDFVSWTNLPPGAADKITKLINSGEKIRHLAFNAEEGWVILFGKDAATWGGNIQQTVVNKLLELANARSVVSQVVFSDQGGWLLWHGKNSIYWEEIPPAAINKLNELTGAGEQVRLVIIDSKNTWIIISEANHIYQPEYP